MKNKQIDHKIIFKYQLKIFLILSLLIVIIHQYMFEYY